MAARRRVEGGPFDGRDASARNVVYAYLDPAGRAHLEPGPGRALYIARGDRWEFAGHGVYQCGALEPDGVGCGAFVEPGADGRRRDACPLCGQGRLSARGGGTSPRRGESDR